MGIGHYHANSLLVGWLLTIFALTIERVCRLAICIAAATGPRRRSSSSACSGSVCVRAGRSTPAEQPSRTRAQALRVSQRSATRALALAVKVSPPSPLATS